MEISSSPSSSLCFDYSSLSSKHSSLLRRSLPFPNNFHTLSLSNCRFSITCQASSLASPPPSLHSQVKSNKNDFVRITDYDKATILKILDHAIEVKALLNSGDKSYQPFKGKTMAMICKTIHKNKSHLKRDSFCWEAMQYTWHLMTFKWESEWKPRMLLAYFLAIKTSLWLVFLHIRYIFKGQSFCSSLHGNCEIISSHKYLLREHMLQNSTQ